MAWDVKYYCEWTDLLGLDWRVDIEKDGSFTAEAMQVTGNPLEIEYLSPSDDLFESNIRGSIAKLNIYSITHFQWSEFYAVEDREYRMSIYYDDSGDVLFWRGYIISDGYQEPYNTIPYATTIVASDGLGMLKEHIYKYTVATVDDTYYNGRMLASQIILDILGKIGYTTFTEYVNIYEESMNTTVNDSPMDQIKIDVDVFKDMYCYDVLCEILKLFNAVIRTVNGVMTIYRPIELIQATICGRIFTAATTKTSTSFAPLQYINRSTNISDINDFNGGTLMIQKPAKKVTITQDYGNKESWIENWKFEGAKWSGGGVAVWDAENWTRTGITAGQIYPISIGKPDESEGCVLTSSNINPNFTDWISQSFGIYAITSTETMCFQFEYQWFNRTGEAVPIDAFYFGIKDDSSDYSLSVIDETYCEWVTPAVKMLISVTGLPDGDSGWLTWKRLFTGLDMNGPFTITFYSLFDVYPSVNIGFRNVEFFASSDEILIKKRKHKGPFPKFARWILKNIDKNYKDYISTYIDNIETVERDYTKTNAINGIELAGNVTLGDVSDTTLDNVIEQFDGSLAIVSYDTLTQTAADFVTDHAADYLPGGVVVTSSGVDVIMTAQTAGVDFTGNTTITNASNDLSGSVVNTQANNAGTVEIDTITLTGSSGTANLTCGALTKLATFDLTLTQTAFNFADAYIGDYAAIGIDVTSDGPDVIFTEHDAEGGFAEASIAPISGDLNGTVADTQEPVAAVKRIDTITLSGSAGTAKIVCDAVPTPSIVNIDVDEIITYSTDWNTRSPGGESKELLQIICDEIAKQYSRPKQFLPLPVYEGDSISNDPHINLLGNFKDDLNADRSDFPAIIDWTVHNCTLSIVNGYVRYTTTAADSYIEKTALSINGTVKRVLSIKYKIISGDPTVGQIWYKTAGHDYSGSYYKTFALTADDNWNIILLDMSDLTAGGTDWIDNIITAIRFDLTDNHPVVLDIDWIGFSRTFVLNKGTFNVKDREWNIDLIEII